jgi:hypothetical protein
MGRRVKRKLPDALQSFGKRWSRRRSAGALRPQRRPPDAVDPRAKNERHGKVTADRWNQ